MTLAARAPLPAINTSVGPSSRRNPSAHSNPSQPRTHSFASSSSGPSSPISPPPSADDYVLAMHDFSPATPNVQCLSFRAGQVIHVLNRDATGWWDGELEGRRGWFPSNYVNTQISAVSIHVSSTSEKSKSRSHKPRSNKGSVSTTGSSQPSSHSPSNSTSSSYAPSYADASEVSCPPIMVPIVHALSLLQNAVAARRVTHFQPSTACVISCVRSVLSATDCLGRDSPFLANYPALASARKHVLSELARLVTQARKVSEGKSLTDPSKLDEEMGIMLNMGEAVFFRVKKFLSVAVDCGVELPERRSMSPSPATLMDEEPGYIYGRADLDTTPTADPNPTPTLQGLRRSSLQRPSLQPSQRAKSTGDLKKNKGRESFDNGEPYDDSAEPGDSSLGHTPAKPSKSRRRDKTPALPHSVNGDSIDYAYASGYTTSGHRGAKASMDSTSSTSTENSTDSEPQSVSPGFPSGPTTTSQVLNTLRLTQDRLLSIIAAFIGHVHSYSNYSHASSKGHLIELTKETVDQVRHLLALVDSVIATPEVAEVKPRELVGLESAKGILFSQTSALVDSIRAITSLPTLENEDQEKGICLGAATGAIRAGAECVTAVQRCLSRRMGEEPFIIHITPPPSPDSIPQGYVGPTTPPSHSASGSRKNTISYLGRKTATLRSDDGHYEDVLEVDEETEMDIPRQEETTIKMRGQMEEEGEYTIRTAPGSTARDRGNSSEPSSRGSESTNTSNVSLSTSNATTPDSSSKSLEESTTLRPLPLTHSFTEDAGEHRDEELSGGRSSEEKSSERLGALKKKIIYGTLPSVPPERPSTANGDVPYAWLLMHDYNERDIQVNAQGLMTGATLAVMVEKMTSHFYTPEPTFVSTFFLTFRLFATPKEFVEAIISRYDVRPPHSRMSQEETVMWQDKKVKVVRVRILNLLKTWLEMNWRPNTDNEFVPLLQDFVNEKLAANPIFGSQCRRLLDILQKRQAIDEPVTPRSLDRVRSADGIRGRDGVSLYSSNAFSSNGAAGLPPTPIINKTLFSSLRAATFTNVSVLDFDVLELARQLTIMESKLYCAISSDDMLDSARPGVRATETVKATTALSNAISGWVIESILNERDLKKRTNLVKFFVKLADRCYNMNNFSTMVAILGALESSPIIRLSKTWVGLPAKTKNVVDAMRKVMKRERNFYNYRQLLRTTPPPAVPFIGTFLTDLLMNGENAAFKPSPLDTKRTLVNFWKFSKIAEIIQEVLRFQVPHNLMEIPEVQKYLSATFDNVKAIGDLTEIHNRSLQIEPRAPDDRTPGVSDSRTGKLDFAWSLRSVAPPAPQTAPA